MTGDYVLATDWDLHALFQIRKKDFKLLKRVVTMGAGEGQLILPSGLCSDYNGDIYLADPRSTRVAIFSKQLQFIKRLGTQPLRSPVDVKVIPSSEYKLYSLLFEEWRHHILLSFRLDCLGTVSEANFFCMDTDGNILIADSERHDIKIFSPSGQLILKIGEEGEGRGQFIFPQWYSYHRVRNYLCCFLEL